MATVTTLTSARIKKLVREALRGAKTGRLTRAQILQHVIRVLELKLTRGQRKILSTQMNNVIGAMIRSHKEPIDRAKRGEKIVLTTWKQTVTPAATRQKIVMSLMHRIRRVEVDCVACGAAISITRFDELEDCKGCGKTIV